MGSRVRSARVSDSALDRFRRIESVAASLCRGVLPADCEQKETKLAKICWRAELCDAARVATGRLRACRSLPLYLPPEFLFPSLSSVSELSFYSRSFASFAG